MTKCTHQWGGVRAELANGTKHYICHACRAFGRKKPGARKVAFWMTKADYWRDGALTLLLGGQP